MIRRARRIALIAIIFLLVSPIMRLIPASGSDDVSMRVLITERADAFRLYVRGRYRLYDFYDNTLLQKGRSLHAEVKFKTGRFIVGSKTYPVSALRIEPYGRSHIYVNKRRLRGDLVIYPAGESRLSVVNHLELESYLYGVLNHEVSHHWPGEALKAQAIAARTFALYQKNVNTFNDYDVRNDIYSQVYGGRASERWATNRAVDATKGQVVTYNGELFPTYYHATCGGHTEDASNLWNIDLPPLKGVSCEFCKKSPYYKWQKKVPLNLIVKRLKAAGYNIESLALLGVVSRNVSGRADKIEMQDDNGVVTLVKAKDFRMIVGPNTVRSTLFDAAIEGNAAVFRGHGWGHGVGMCQWGANGMARQGYSAEEIIKYYYPGTEISRLESLREHI